MNLYLVQHAIAKSKEDDPDRPISDEGFQEMNEFITFVKENVNIKISSIFHSGKTRAHQTAETISRKIAPSVLVKTVEGMNPMDDVQLISDRLKSMTTDTMLVGHLPHLSKLASLLLTGDATKEIVRFSNSGIVCLNNDFGEWVVVWTLVPEILKRNK